VPETSELRQALLTALTKTEDTCRKDYPETTEAITFLRNIIRHPNSHENTVPWSITHKVTIAHENPRLIQHPKFTSPAILTVSRPFVFFKALNRKYELGLSEGHLERISTVLGEALPTNWGISFEIVGGRAIKKVYEDTPATCMTNKKAIQFYVNNDPNIRILKIMKNGALFGRALLWSLQDGRHFVDRPYPASGPHLEALETYIRQQDGWVYRGSASIDVPRTLDRNIITAPLETPGMWRQTHTMGDFPYQDTFRAMKHSPDKAQVMLRIEVAPGWVPIGFLTAYDALEYCTHAKGWYDRSEFATAPILNSDNGFRAEIQTFHLPTIRRTHTLISYVYDTEERVLFPNQALRAYVLNDAVEILKDEVTGKNFLRKHAVQTPNGVTFIADAFSMHDGTFLRQNGNLRRVAQLPNGKFILREEADYSPATRSWSPKEPTHDEPAINAAAAAS
jgi:hypothetical protein